MFVRYINKLAANTKESLDKMKNLESYQQLNLKFYDALSQIFNLKKVKTWNELSKIITLDKISETYKVFGQIFSTDLDRYSILPKNDPKLKMTSIFHGAPDGMTIINNIARHSLYTDEIIVFHPLQNPNITSQKYDPITKPNLWRNEFVNSLYFYIVLQKWVRSGLVHMIESPFNFDIEARRKLIEQAKLRVESSGDIMNEPEIRGELDEMQREKLKRSLLGSPISAIEKTLSRTFPKLPENQIKLMAIELKEREKKLPLYVDFGDDQTESLMLSDSGGNIEMIDALCNLTGANSYTTQKSIKRQLELRGTNPFWTKFGSLYSGLDLTYLDKVDTSFALMIRQEDRISGLRKTFRELSSFLEQTELDKISDDKILHFKDKFNEEVKRSEVEWMKIIDDAKKINITSLVGGNVIGAFIDPTKIIIPAVGIPSSIIINEYFKKRGLKSYRSKDPYSVFVDLKNNKPSFFSELKNCIL